jgi:hypothetical protein
MSNSIKMMLLTFLFRYFMTFERKFMQKTGRDSMNRGVNKRKEELNSTKSTC